MPIVNYETVAAAVQAIKAEGGKPTNRLIQERLGGGSLSTVHKYYSQLLSDPGRVEADFNQEIRPVHDAISVMARRLHAKAKANLETSLKGLEDDLAKFAQELAKTEKERDEAVKKLGDLETQLAHRQEDLAIEKRINEEFKAMLARRDDSGELPLALAALERAESSLAEARRERDAVASQLGLVSERLQLAEANLKELSRLNVEAASPSKPPPGF
ncbi:MAG: DNA-binding protein [Deltaproteobacteria bacterium]|jgi:chromosome segregation ATPase|nr:DNA-binding protein [Deltaproteobacteria bacterium]